YRAEDAGGDPLRAHATSGRIRNVLFGVSVRAVILPGLQTRDKKLSGRRFRGALFFLRAFAQLRRTIDPAGRSYTPAQLKECRKRSALGELEAAARFGLAVLLTLDHARVAGEEASMLEHGAQIGLVPHQCLRESMTHGAGLSRQSAAGDRAGHVVLALAIGGDE